MSPTVTPPVLVPVSMGVKLIDDDILSQIDTAVAGGGGADAVQILRELPRAVNDIIPYNHSFSVVAGFTSPQDEPYLEPMVIVFMMTAPQIGFPTTTTPNGLAQTDVHPDLTMCGVDLQSDPDDFVILKVHYAPSEKFRLQRPLMHAFVLGLSNSSGEFSFVAPLRPTHYFLAATLACEHVPAAKLAPRGS
jgi:hypothetical protein